MSRLRITAAIMLSSLSNHCSICSWYSEQVVNRRRAPYSSYISSETTSPSSRS